MRVYISIGNIRNIYANLRKCLCETCMTYVASTYTDSRYSKLQLQLQLTVYFLFSFSLASIYSNVTAFDHGFITIKHV